MAHVTVDPSGSMLESAIFSAVMASLFYELPAVRTSMVLFDTNVVDMTDKVGQPVDVLMSAYLGWWHRHHACVVQQILLSTRCSTTSMTTKSLSHH